MENSLKDWSARPSYLFPEKPVCRSKSNRTRPGMTDWFKIGEGALQGCVTVTCLSNLCRAPHAKCWAGWITGWNQDCQEKYQQPQVRRRHHYNGGKCRGPKKPLDEGVKKPAWNSMFKELRSWHLVPSFMANRWGKSRNWKILLGWGAPKPLCAVTAATAWKESYNKLDSVLKNKTSLCPQRPV